MVTRTMNIVEKFDISLLLKTIVMSIIASCLQRIPANVLRHVGGRIDRAGGRTYKRVRELDPLLYRP